MTLAELRHLVIPRFGPLWQSPLARAIGAHSRTMRRVAAGQQITASMEARIRGAVGEPQSALPRDEWLSARAKGHRYLVHARAPRFIALVTANQAEAGRAQGIVNRGPAWTLCEIVWIDAPPPAPALAKLFTQAHKELPKS